MTTEIQNATDNYQVTFSPTDKQVSEIEKWLIAERQKTRDGFYCNWNNIKSSFDNNELATISVNNKTIGFVTWQLTTNKTARIEITEVKPTHRKKRIGKRLIGHLLDFFKEKNIYVVDLQCAPADSEPFWKHLGFVEFPEPQENYKFGSNKNKKLYKILIAQLQQSLVQENGEIIELWNDEPYRTNEKTPSCIWNLKFINKTRRLLKPIIYPANNEWRIRWSKNRKTIKDLKVKRFPTEIDFDSFIIIDKLSHLKDEKL